MLAKIKDDVYIRISQGTYFIMAAKPHYICHCISHFIRYCISQNLNKNPCYRRIVSSGRHMHAYRISIKAFVSASVVPQSVANRITV